MQITAALLTACASLASAATLATRQIWTNPGPNHMDCHTPDESSGAPVTYNVTEFCRDVFSVKNKVGCPRRRARRRRR